MPISTSQLSIPEMQAQQEAILRRRKIAEAMMQQGMAPLESIGTAGGAPIPISHAQGLNKLAAGYLGQQDVKAADTAQADLQNQYATAQEEAIRKVQQAMQNQPAIAAPSDEQGGGPGRPEIIQTPESRRQAVIDAQLSQFPQVQKFGQLQQGFLEKDMTREDTQAAAKAAAAEKAQAAADAAAIKAQADAQALQDKLEAKKESDSRHNETLIAIRSMSAGDKLQAEKEKEYAKKTVKEESKRGFSDSLDVLEAKYKELDELGGIVNPEKSGLSNIGARISSSAVGQALGGAVGTDEQSIRNEIQGTIPLLILDIKNMTGASAQQMNSNVELQNFLRSASSPTSDIRANLKLLKNLRKKYLGGGEETLSTPSGEPKEENWVRDANGKLVKQ